MLLIEVNGEISRSNSPLFIISIYRLIFQTFGIIQFIISYPERSEKRKISNFFLTFKIRIYVSLTHNQVILYLSPLWCHRSRNSNAKTKKQIRPALRIEGGLARSFGQALIPYKPIPRITRVCARVLIGGEAKRAPRQVGTRARRRSINVDRRSVKQYHVASIIDGNPSSA